MNHMNRLIHLQNKVTNTRKTPFRRSSVSAIVRGEKRIPNARPKKVEKCSDRQKKASRTALNRFLGANSTGVRASNGDQRARTPCETSLMARKGSSRDLAECYDLHDLLGLPYTETARRILPEMWYTLLSTGAMQLFLVEDRTKPEGSRVVSFNAVVFVTDEFCSDARSTLPPYLGIELVRCYLSHQLPLLNREQIAQGNAIDGLNIVMCFEGWAGHGFSHAQFLSIREKQNEALHLALRGYRIKEFLTDTIGQETSQWLLDAGAHLRRDYSNYFRQNRLAKPECSQRPYLVGLTREEALAHPGGNIAGLFIFTAPRFYFSRSEQVLLQHALMGETCKTLATSLSLSPWTVKKRWHAIYDRVANIDNHLLPPAIAYGVHALSRGTERRRHLLNYLRQHLEELRPYQPPKRKTMAGSGSAPS